MNPPDEKIKFTAKISLIKKELANSKQSDKIPLDLKVRLEDALRRLNMAADDIKEIRRAIAA